MLLVITCIYGTTTLSSVITNNLRQSFYKNDEFRMFIIRIDYKKQTIKDCFETLEKIDGINEFEKINEFDIEVIVDNYNLINNIKKIITNKGYRVFVNSNKAVEVMKTESLIQNFNLILIVILIVFFLSMTFIMFKIFHERNKEIALYKSIGYSNFNILFIFLTEFIITQITALFISIISCYCFSYYCCSYLLKNFFHIDMNIYSYKFNAILFIFIQLTLSISIIISSFFQLKSVDKIEISILIKD